MKMNKLKVYKQYVNYLKIIFFKIFAKLFKKNLKSSLSRIVK